MNAIDMNYYNDHRVQALGDKPWYVELKTDKAGSTGHVVIRIPTADYHWLVENDYSPDEFDGGLKPLVHTERVAGERDCWRCNGTSVRWQHPEYPGSVMREKNSTHTVEYPCLDCCKGKEWVFRDLETPVLDEGAEDRLYFPYRMVAFPCTMENCPTCGGDGRHVNPSIDAGGITDMDDWDDDERDGYFGGRYDVTCYGCKGAKRAPVITPARMCPEDRELYETWRKWQDEQDAEEAGWAAEAAAERRMGC